MNVPAEPTSKKQLHGNPEKTKLESTSVGGDLGVGNKSGADELDGVQDANPVQYDMDSKQLDSNQADSKQIESELFELDGLTDTSAPEFELESPFDDSSAEPEQVEIYLPEQDPDLPANDQQIEFESLAPPLLAIEIQGNDKPLHFQRASSLLDSLEYQGVDIPFQCREGYCGACRTELVEGEVAYLQEPMAWINDGEILPCCCVPKTNLKIKVSG